MKQLFTIRIAIRAGYVISPQYFAVSSYQASFPGKDFVAFFPGRYSTFHLVRKARMSDNRGTLMSLLSSPPDISDLLVGTRDARASSNCSKEIFYLWK